MSVNGGAFRPRSVLRATVVLLAVGGRVADPPLPAREAAGPAPRAQAPGEYIVTLRPDSDPAVVHAAFRDYEVIELRRLVGPHHLLRLARDPGLDTIRSIAPPSVVAVQPNYEYRAQ